MIRAADLDDIPRLVDMGRRFIEETEYRSAIGFNHHALAALMRKLIAMGDGAIFVLTPAQTPVGMIGVHVFAHPLSGETFAAEVFWGVDPEWRGPGKTLVTIAEDWARGKGAVKMHMISPSDKVARAYRRLGYAKLEEHYQKDL